MHCRNPARGVTKVWMTVSKASQARAQLTHKMNLVKGSLAMAATSHPAEPWVQKTANCIPAWSCKLHTSLAKGNATLFKVRVEKSLDPGGFQNPKLLHLVRVELKLVHPHPHPDSFQAFGQPCNRIICLAQVVKLNITSMLMIVSPCAIEWHTHCFHVDLKVEKGEPSFLRHPKLWRPRVHQLELATEKGEPPENHALQFNPEWYHSWWYQKLLRHSEQLYHPHPRLSRGNQQAWPMPSWCYNLAWTPTKEGPDNLLYTGPSEAACQLPSQQPFSRREDWRLDELSTMVGFQRWPLDTGVYHCLLQSKRAAHKSINKSRWYYPNSQRGINYHLDSATCHLSVGFNQLVPEQCLIMVNFTILAQFSKIKYSELELII